MRGITAEELADLPRLPVSLPRGGTSSFPFSYTRHDRYKMADLLCEDGDSTARTDTFRKTLAALYWVLGEQPVPYAFRTANGEVRSMDAGCLGMLRRAGTVEFVINQAGYVEAVRPGPQLIQSLTPLRAKLVAAIVPE